jgi:predicted acetyltransferase
MDSQPPSDLPNPPRLQSEELKLILEKTTSANPQKGYVPAYSFGIQKVADQERVGHMNLRIGSTDHVIMYAGHIGFGIDENHRGNSYAFKACVILKDLAISFYDSVILTCNPHNIASIKTIEKLGAKFIEEVEIPVGNPIRDIRGETHKRRYEWTLKE